MLKRILKMQLPKGQSAFLWGARQTGKSSFLKKHFSEAVYYDLLDTHELARLSKEPYILRQELILKLQSVPSLLVIVDEIQKVPDLLNEVHWLIENKPCQFILCGSSARKLKTQSTNLLGGRAWKYHFYPLVYPEVPDFDLLRALQHGLIPTHYLSDESMLDNHLQAYVEIYLTDEIRNEGLVRNLAGFARFLDVAGISNGEMINLKNIASDCGIDRHTVQNYFQILIDTMLGYYVYPYRKRVKRDIIHSTPKFYLFDTGVANYLARQKITGLKGSLAGKTFEHYILMELMAFKHFKRQRFEICYWRTKTGLEVDFVLGNAEIAIEIKISDQVRKSDLKGLVAFSEEHPKAKAMVVSLDKRARVIELESGAAIEVLPWELFLEQLWSGQLI